MGWQFTAIKDIDALIHVLRSKDQVEDYELIGNELYAVFRADDGRRFIVICLLEWFPGGWAYLPADETMHPENYHCPLRLLDQSDIPDTSRWRENCRMLRQTLDRIAMPWGSDRFIFRDQKMKIK